VDEQDPAPRAADGLVLSAARSTANLGLGAQLPSNSSSSFGERGTDEEDLRPTNRRRAARRPSRPEQARRSHGLVEEYSDEDGLLLDDQGAGALGREHQFERTLFIIYEDGIEE